MTLLNSNILSLLLEKVAYFSWIDFYNLVVCSPLFEAIVTDRMRQVVYERFSTPINRRILINNKDYENVSDDAHFTPNGLITGTFSNSTEWIKYINGRLVCICKNRKVAPYNLKEIVTYSPSLIQTFTLGDFDRQKNMDKYTLVSTIKNNGKYVCSIIENGIVNYNVAEGNFVLTHQYTFKGTSMKLHQQNVPNREEIHYPSSHVVCAVNGALKLKTNRNNWDVGENEIINTLLVRNKETKKHIHQTKVIIEYDTLENEPCTLEDFLIRRKRQLSYTGAQCDEDKSSCVTP